LIKKFVDNNCYLIIKYFKIAGAYHRKSLFVHTTIDMRKNKGLFITFEGPEGSGKTTQSLLLFNYLQSKGYNCIHTREPGGTTIAESLRQILLNPSTDVSPLTELLLYIAGRAQHTDELILPALKRGDIVVCERYRDAAVAYQGSGRKIPVDTIEKLNDIATHGLLPDVTILLDIPSAEGLKKARSAKKRLSISSSKISIHGDRFEREDIKFHNRVRKGYFKLAHKYPKRFKVIRTAKTIEETHRSVVKAVSKKIKHLPHA